MITSALRWDDVYATNGTINTSDIRDKSDVREIEYGLDEVLRLRPVCYKWKGKEERGEKLGLIAQELLEIVPEVVKILDYKLQEDNKTVVKDELERLGVYYSDLIPVLIKSIREQQDIIDEQQRLIVDIREEMKALNNRLESVEMNGSESLLAGIK